MPFLSDRVVVVRPSVRHGCGRRARPLEPPPVAKQRANPVDGSQPNQPVDDPATGVRLAKGESEHRGDEVELRDRDQAQLRAPTSTSAAASASSFLILVHLLSR